MPGDLSETLDGSREIAEMHDGSREIESRADTNDGSRERFAARCVGPPRGEISCTIACVGPPRGEMERMALTEPLASVRPAPASGDISSKSNLGDISSKSNGVVAREVEVVLEMAPPSEAPSRALYGPPIACIAGVLHAAGSPALATAPCTGCTGLKPSAH
jgi:hypothetical protein